MKPSLHLVKSLKNQSGQIAVEYILLSVIFVAIFLSARNILVSENVLGNFVQKPWALVAGMIETGVWGDVNKVRGDHPGALRRHTSFKGIDE